MRVTRRTSFFFCAVVVLLPAVSADAHTASDWFPDEWGIVNRSAVQIVWADTDFLVGGSGETARDRIKDGAAQWNNLDSDFAFVATGAYNFTLSTNPCNNGVNQNAYFWRNFTGGSTLAQTTRCIGPNGTAIISYVVEFASDHEWYTGTGGPPSDKFDVWSVASHEQGHAAGFAGHWTGSGAADCSSGAGRETMCSGTSAGTTMKRSLETHDSHTFENAY